MRGSLDLSACLHSSHAPCDDSCIRCAQPCCGPRVQQADQVDRVMQHPVSNLAASTGDAVGAPHTHPCCACRGGRGGAPLSAPDLPRQRPVMPGTHRHQGHGIAVVSRAAAAVAVPNWSPDALLPTTRCMHTHWVRKLAACLLSATPAACAARSDLADLSVIVSDGGRQHLRVKQRCCGVAHMYH
jgi:hypothetical protein